MIACIHCAEWYGMLNRVDWASASQGRKWLAIKKPNVVVNQPGSPPEEATMNRGKRL